MVKSTRMQESCDMREKLREEYKHQEEAGIATSDYIYLKGELGDVIITHEGMIASNLHEGLKNSDTIFN